MGIKSLFFSVKIGKIGIIFGIVFTFFTSILIVFILYILVLDIYDISSISTISSYAGLWNNSIKLCIDNNDQITRKLLNNFVDYSISN